MSYRRSKLTYQVAFAMLSLALCATIIKAGSMAAALQNSDWGLATVSCFKIDRTLWVMLLIASLAIGRGPRFLRSAALVLIIFTAILYAVDTAVYIATQQRFCISGVFFAFQFAGAATGLIPWQDMRTMCIAMLAGFLVGAAVGRPPSKLRTWSSFLKSPGTHMGHWDWRLCGVCALPILISFFSASGVNSILMFKCPFDWIYLKWSFYDSMKNGIAPKDYSDDEARFGKDQILRLVDFDPRQIPQKVILVAVESLSAKYSKRTSGIHDLVPEFDQLADKGTLFTNVYANGTNSNYGATALVHGMPPAGCGSRLSNPYYVMDLYRWPSPVLRKLNDAGWDTAAVSGYVSQAATVKEEWLQRAGFGEVEFPPNSEDIFETVGARGISDSALNEMALRTLRRQENIRSPYLLFVETAQTHKVWGKCSSTPGPECKSTLHEVSTALADFVSKLEQMNFFSSGVLVMIADHTNPGEISWREQMRYGDSAKFRIPMLVIGNGVEKGRIDERFVQQADVLPRLNRILDPNSVISTVALGTERFQTNEISVMTADSPNRIRLTVGSREPLRWETKPNKAAEDYLRALRQHCQAMSTEPNDYPMPPPRKIWRSER